MITPKPERRDEVRAAFSRAIARKHQVAVAVNEPGDNTSALGVVAVIGNDAAWMQIRRGQVELYGVERATATALEYTRYEKVVEALGGFGAYVDRVEDLGPALDAAFAAGKPACVNVKIASSDFRKGAISV